LKHRVRELIVLRLQRPQVGSYELDPDPYVSDRRLVMRSPLKRDDPVDLRRARSDLTIDEREAIGAK
jgi:hypothetical protein